MPPAGRLVTTSGTFRNAARRSQVGSESFAWSPRDVFVVPSWQPVAHEAQEESVLFSFSDRAAQKALGVWREEA